MYRVGIIGLGSIAARYSNPDDPYPYCHTGGIRHCNTTELVAVADMSAERQNEFKSTWGPAFPNKLRAILTAVHLHTVPAITILLSMKSVSLQSKAEYLDKQLNCHVLTVRDSSMQMDNKNNYDINL